MDAAIEARGLVKRFGRTVALDGLDLTVEAGRLAAVLGPNGAGKTTLVRAVATLQALHAGSLLVNGHDVRREPAAVRRSIGLAGQHAAVEPTLTGRENLEMVARLVGLSRRSAREAAGALLERFGLEEAADRLAKTYSGGMRRKLDLGASLVGSPRLLLLDEPTTGLDPRSRLELWDAIRSLVRTGTDVLLTTQYLEEADHLADLVVIVDRGRAVASGTPSELKRRVGGSVIDVHVRDLADLPAAATAIGSLDHARVHVDEVTRRVSVGVEEGDDRLTHAVRAVAAAGVEIDDISLRRPTLDEVFLALTGRGVGEDEHEAA